MQLTLRKYLLISIFILGIIILLLNASHSLENIRDVNTQVDDTSQTSHSPSIAPSIPVTTPTYPSTKPIGIGNGFLMSHMSDRCKCPYDDEIRSMPRLDQSSCWKGKPYKVAFSLRGMLRVWCNRHLDEHIWKFNNVDIFLHHWTFKSNSVRDALLERYSPVSYFIDPPNVTKPFEATCLHIENPWRSVVQHTHMFWGIGRSLEAVRDYEREHGFRYDLVVNARYDIGSDHIMPMGFFEPCPDPTKMYSPFWPELNHGISDQVLYSSSENMEIVSKMKDAYFSGEITPTITHPNTTFMIDLHYIGMPYWDPDNIFSTLILNKNYTDIQPLVRHVAPLMHVRNAHMIVKWWLWRHGLLSADVGRYYVSKYTVFWWEQRLDSFCEANLPKKIWGYCPIGVDPNLVEEGIDVSEDRGKTACE